MHVIIRFIYFYSFIHQQYNDDGVDLGCGWGKIALALFFSSIGRSFDKFFRGRRRGWAA